MQDISKTEFQDRIEAIQKARRIFNNLTDNNITRSFIAYQEVLAEEKRKIALNTRENGRVPSSPLIDDNYIRPHCPECKTKGKINVPLYMRLIRNCDGKYVPKGPSNKFGWKSVWECHELYCVYEQYSRMSLEDWLEKLPRKNHAN